VNLAVYVEKKIYVKKGCIIIEKIKNKKSYIIIGLIIILVILVFTGKQLLTNKAIVSNDYKNLVNNNITINKTYKIYNFGSALCPACRQMDPIYEKIKEEYKSLLEFEYVDVNKDFKLSYTYGIEYTPTFIVVDDTGTKVDKLVGAVSETEFRKFVDKWSNK